jgi:hypothetical protein
MSQATFNEDIINTPSMSDPYQTITLEQTINPIQTPKSAANDLIDSYDAPESLIDIQVQPYPDMIEQNMYYFDQFNK